MPMRHGSTSRPVYDPPMPDPPEPPGREDDAHPSAAARRMADAATDATFGGAAGTIAPPLGLLVGEVGPKADVSNAMRDLNRSNRRRGEFAPSGSSVPGMAWLLAGAVLTMVIVAAAIIAALIWATS